MSLVRDENHLRELLRIDYTPAQMAAITAGLDQPTAIIAGAGHPVASERVAGEGAGGTTDRMLDDFRAGFRVVHGDGGGVGRERGAG